METRGSSEQLSGIGVMVGGTEEMAVGAEAEIKVVRVGALCGEAAEEEPSPGGAPMGK